MSTVSQEVEANLKIRGQDGQSIYAELVRSQAGIGALSTAAQDLGKKTKSNADVSTSAAGLAVGTVGRKVKTKVETRDRDEQSIKGRTCMVAGRRRWLNTAAQDPDRVEAVIRVKVGDRSKAGTAQWQGRPRKRTSARPQPVLPEGKPGCDGPEQRPEKAGATWPKLGPRWRRPRYPHRGVSSAGAKTLAFFRSERDAKSRETRAGEHATGKTCSKQALGGRHLQSSGLRSRCNFGEGQICAPRAVRSAFCMCPCCMLEYLCCSSSSGRSAQGERAARPPGSGSSPRAPTLFCLWRLISF